MIQLRVPSLSERRDDVPLLVDHFVRKFAKREAVPAPQVDPGCLPALQAHPWPGNVRQLEHAVERAMILGQGESLWIDPPESADLDGAEVAASRPELPSPLALPAEGLELPDALQRYERDLIVAALQACEGVQAKAARMLGVSRSNLNYRIQKLGITVQEIRYS